MTTALVVLGIVAAYATVALLVFGYLTERRGMSSNERRDRFDVTTPREEAGLIAGLWPFVAFGMSLTWLVARLGSLGRRAFRKRTVAPLPKAPREPLHREGPFR